MKFKDLVLCSDLDGTLINEENIIPKENIEAIKYFRAHGGKFMIATGRVPEAVFPVIGDLKTDFPCICHNGCSVYDLNKMEYIETVPLPDGAVSVAEEIMKESNRSGVEVMTMQGICVVKSTPATDFHIQFEKVDFITADKIENAPKPWFKILFAQSPAETDIIKEKFLKSRHNEKYNLQKTHSFYYEIFNKNASKGTALKKICENYKIDLKNIIAIGDNENDISMLSVAGKSAAVSNVPDFVKEYADIITCSNEQGAIADLIYKL